MEIATRGRSTGIKVKKVKDGDVTNTEDDIVTEEPLEIRVYYGQGAKERHESLSVTMRTPGNDFELAAGFLFTEGVVSSKDDITRITYCVDVGEGQQYNIVNVHLGPSAHFDPKLLSRHFYTASSCGVCGKASLEALHVSGCQALPKGGIEVSAETIPGLTEKLRNAQSVFKRTGGLHASGLFDAQGRLELVREDIGRHNALDKLIGAELLAGRIPLSKHLCVASGRIGFELVQKSLVAGIPILAAVGAPSSLAVQLAKEFDMTLVGFVRGGSFNIYTGAERILFQGPARHDSPQTPV